MQSGNSTYGRVALVPLILLALVLGMTIVSDAFFTIQTGTYSPAALHFARKQYSMLAATLGEEGSQHLRILHGSKYYIVRLGRFESYEEARNVLDRVRSIAADAFILDESASAEIPILEAYDTGGSGSKAGVADAGDNRPDTSPVPHPVKGDAVSEGTQGHRDAWASPEEYYTLQTGNFLKLPQATEEMERLTRLLQGDDLKDLRIEDTGGSFSVRLGRFETYAEARDLRQRHQDILPGANILRSSAGGAQRHPDGTSLPSISSNQVGQTAPGETEAQTRKEADAERQKLEIADFFREVSSQYYDQQYGRAAELLRKGIAKWPDNADLRAWYGATLLNMRFSENALEQYRKAIELSPDVSDFHAGAGHSLLSIYMARAKESIDAFKKALEIDPDNVSALEGLGFAYASIGRKDQASDVLSRLEKLDRNAAERLSQAITVGVDWGE